MPGYSQDNPVQDNKLLRSDAGLQHLQTPRQVHLRIMRRKNTQAMRVGNHGIRLGNCAIDSEGLTQFFNLSVYVIPSAMLMHEAAALMQLVRFAIDSTCRDKLDPVS